MRGLVGLVLLTSLMISGDLLAQTGTDAAPVQRDWLRNYEQASQMSSQSGRALLIHFYADWCGPCKQMEREILQSGELKAMFGTHAVAVKVNSDDRSDLVSRFGITGLPTDLIVRDGKVIWRQVGSPGRTAYLAQIASLNRTVPSTNTAPAKSNPGRDGKTVATRSEKPVAIEQTALIDPVLLPPAAPEVKKAEPEALVSSEPAAKSVVLLPSQTGLVGLSGYCPVSLKQGAEWKQGVASKRVVVEGVAYQLADVVDQDEFKAAPEKFIPAYHGLDSVMLRDGRIKPGVTGLKTTFGGRDYYFASKETLERFLQTPATYSSLRISLNFGTADGA